MRIARLIAMPDMSVAKARDYAICLIKADGLEPTEISRSRLQKDTKELRMELFLEVGIQMLDVINSGISRDEYTNPEELISCIRFVRTALIIVITVIWRSST